MTAHPRTTSAEIILAEDRADRARQALIEAKARQFYDDPKLAYGIVTGACTWPPVNGEQLGELAVMAANLASDYEALGYPANQIDDLRVAEMAFVWREADAEREARLEAWRDEEAEPSRLSRGWQGVL